MPGTGQESQQLSATVMVLAEIVSGCRAVNWDLENYSTLVKATEFAKWPNHWSYILQLSSNPDKQQENQSNWKNQLTAHGHLDWWPLMTLYPKSCQTCQYLLCSKEREKAITFCLKKGQISNKRSSVPQRTCWDLTYHQGIRVSCWLFFIDFRGVYWPSMGTVPSNSCRDLLVFLWLGKGGRAEGSCSKLFSSAISSQIKTWKLIIYYESLGLSQPAPIT